jgi:Protein of unknown function (DUF2924)
MTDTEQSTTMTARIQALQQMSTAQLREEWRRVMGEEPRSYHRTWLWRRLAWAIQAKEYGGLSARAQERLNELLPQAEAWMPLGRKAFQGIGTPLPVPSTKTPALPTPGTVLTRKYRDRTIAVTVLEGGFDFEGKRYASLTAVAKAVTGAHWNGRAFFGLVDSKRRRG